MNEKSNIKTAIFGAGCFWCTEAIFKNITGVISVEPGYSGGIINNPTYQEVCVGSTGHAEVVKITYNPEVIDFETLVKINLLTHDPTTLNKQGNDEGTQYRSVIYFNDDSEKNIIENVISEMSSLYEEPIITEIKKAETFYPAENYHKDYFQNNPNNPYCKFVIAPKVAKFRKMFIDKLK